MNEPISKTLGTLILISTHYEVGTFLPAAEIKEDSTDAELFLFVESCIANPHFHPKIYESIQTILQRGAEFGDRVQIGYTQDSEGWSVHFTPKGWKTTVTLGKVKSLALAPQHNSDFYNLYTRAVLEIAIAKLARGKSLVVGRDSSLPGLNTVTTLSRKHATITRLGPDKFKVIDHKSKNGTFVYNRSKGWKGIKSRATLVAGSLISLGSDSAAFQFKLPESEPKEFLEWKATCITQITLLKPGQVIAIIPPNWRGRPDRGNAFEVLREVVWTYILHPLYRRNKLYIPSIEGGCWDLVKADLTVPAYLELRMPSEKSLGFYLPGEALKKITSAREGDVITLGCREFGTNSVEVEAEHIALLIVDKNNFMILNKSERGAIYYRLEDLTWHLLEETQRLPAGSDIMLGIPTSCVCFTLPKAASAGSLESHAIL
jgi:hypothetical protein